MKTHQITLHKNMRYKPKLLYFVTEDWYFCSHRLSLAKAAQHAGFDVSVLTRVTDHGEMIQSAGLNLIPLNIARGGVNPIKEFRTLLQILLIYRRLRPDLVHHVALKPVLYGSMAALFIPALRSVNLLAGLGAVFSSTKWQARLLRPVVTGLFRSLLGRSNTLTIVQNRKDYALLSNRLRIPAARLRLIKGSGIDIEHFYPAAFPAEPVSVALVSRLLWDKGVGKYIAAVKLLKRKGLIFNALLVGKPDVENMASISPEQLQAWVAEGDVQCLGHIEAVAEFWRNTHIAVLPSYREGLPKCLLEAAASGRPIIATDTSGCKEIVTHGVNGLLVPVKRVQELAEAMEQLILDEELRSSMGASSRQRAVQEFSNAVIFTQTLAVYQELIAPKLN